jgi:hypothetical protein
MVKEKTRGREVLHAAHKKGDWISIGDLNARGTKLIGRVVIQVGNSVYYRIWDPIKKAFGRNARTNVNNRKVRKITDPRK